MKNNLKDKAIFLENVLKENNEFLKSITQTFYDDVKEVKLIKCIPFKDEKVEYIKIKILVNNTNSTIKIKL